MAWQMASCREVSTVAPGRSPIPLLLHASLPARTRWESRVVRRRQEQGSKLVASQSLVDEPQTPYLPATAGSPIVVPSVALN